MPFLFSLFFSDMIGGGKYITEEQTGELLEKLSLKEAETDSGSEGEYDEEALAAHDRRNVCRWPARSHCPLPRRCL